jgi:hypothetical protein
VFGMQRGQVEKTREMITEMVRMIEGMVIETKTWNVPVRTWADLLRRVLGRDSSNR